MGGSALILGALIAWFVSLPQRLIAAVIAVGAPLDGIPASVVIGVSLQSGGGVSAVTVAAVFLSNVPKGLSSAAGMKKTVRGPGSVFGVWGGIAAASGIAAMVGNVALAGASPEIVAAVAVGAILAMLVDTMIAEATEATHEYSGRSRL